MQPLRVTTLRVMRMIELQDTHHGVQYWVVQEFYFESLDDEKSLSETTTIAVP